MPNMEKPTDDEITAEHDRAVDLATRIRNWETAISVNGVNPATALTYFQGVTDALAWVSGNRRAPLDDAPTAPTEN